MAAPLLEKMIPNSFRWGHTSPGIRRLAPGIKHVSCFCEVAVFGGKASHDLREDAASLQRIPRLQSGLGGLFSFGAFRRRNALRFSGIVPCKPR